MMGWHAMQARATAAGLEFVTYRSLPPWLPGLRHEDGWERLSAALFGTATEHDVLDEARAFGANLILVDCMLTAGYAAARQLERPIVSLVHPLYQPFVHEWGSSVLGISVEDLLPASDSVLALQPPGFDRPGPLPMGTAYVGAILSPDDPPPLAELGLDMLVDPGDPWVLVSLSSTLQGQREALPRLLSSLSHMPVRVLLTLGGVIAPDTVPTPANVTVRGDVPHAAVLPHVEAVVTHAGMSTVATALAAGVPMVCVPQGRDQPLNAARVVEVGAGLHVPADAAPGQLREALNAVLADRRFRFAAERFANHTARLGNGQSATDMVESLLVGN
jgi:hypothetical protein